MNTETKIKPFWVIAVNNYLCGAGYSKNDLKEKYCYPSFAKFYFIRSMSELNGFTKRSEMSNEDIVKMYLTPN